MRNRFAQVFIISRNAIERVTEVKGSIDPVRGEFRTSLVMSGAWPSFHIGVRLALFLSEAENIVQDGVIKRKTFRAFDIEA